MSILKSKFEIFLILVILLLLYKVIEIEIRANKHAQYEGIKESRPSAQQANVCVHKYELPKEVRSKKYLDFRKKFLDSLNIPARDFTHYNCSNITRIGGLPQFVSVADHKLFRIDGAWFVCFDKGVEPVVSKCNVFSFGVNRDPSFDIEMVDIYKCNVHSFDPVVEDYRFTAARRKLSSVTNASAEHAVSVKVKDNWTFHRIGIVGHAIQRANPNVIGWMATFDDILEYTKMWHQVIDVFKMDIEGWEWPFLETIDVEYACKYIKQFMLETHNFDYLGRYYDTDPGYALLMKLQRCFSIFFRNTRHYKGDKPYKTGALSEWQIKEGFFINTVDHRTEIRLANYMFAFGEIYFVNENFLPEPI